MSFSSGVQKKGKFKSPCLYFIENISSFRATRALNMFINEQITTQVFDKLIISTSQLCSG